MLQTQHSQRQFKEVTAFLMFILTTGISIAYYVTFKNYHTAVAKMDSLKKLLSNPNARVAAGKTGRDILKRVNKDKKKKETKKKQKEAPKKIIKSTKANETVDMLQQLIKARQAEKLEQQYEAPLLQQ